MQPLKPGHLAPGGGVDDLDRLRFGGEATDDEGAVLIDPMHAEEAERISVVSGDDRLDVVMGCEPVVRHMHRLCRWQRR